MPRRCLAARCEADPSKTPVPVATLATKPPASPLTTDAPILAAGPQLLAHRARPQARVPRRRRGLLSCGARSRARSATIDLHPRLGHRQPPAPRAGGRERRLAGAARRLPERAGEQATRAARVRAELGLRDAVPARARMDAAVQARLAHAPAIVVPAGRAAPDRRLAPPEGRRRRRLGRVRQRLRPVPLALGHFRAPLRGAAAPQPVRPDLRAVSRRRCSRRRRMRALDRRTGARAMVPSHRQATAGGRRGTGRRSLAGVVRARAPATSRSRSLAPSPRSRPMRASPRCGSSTSMRSRPRSATSSRKTSTSPRGRSPMRSAIACVSRTDRTSRSSRPARRAAGSR